MPVTDPISDMLTRVRNAIQVGHDSVDVPTSKMKTAIAKILKEEGFIADYDTVEQEPQVQLRMSLRYYEDGEPVLKGLRRVSRPGLRVYVGRNEIPRYYGGLGVAFLSTPKGVLTGRDAWRQGVGGELLLYVW